MKGEGLDGLRKSEEDPGMPRLTEKANDQSRGGEWTARWLMRRVGGDLLYRSNSVPDEGGEGRGLR